MPSKADKGILPLPVHAHTSPSIADGYPLLQPKENVRAIDCLGDERDLRDPNSLLKDVGVRLVNSKGEVVTLVNSPKTYAHKKKEIV